MEIINNKFGKFFGPSFTWTGYMLLAAGLIAMSYSFTSLVLIIPGIFVAFTYSGTLIDPVNRQILTYLQILQLPGLKEDIPPIAVGTRDSIFIPTKSGYLW
jgi:hypothetical protein